MDTCVWIDVEGGVLAPADVEVLTHGEPIHDFEDIPGLKLVVYQLAGHKP